MTISGRKVTSLFSVKSGRKVTSLFSVKRYLVDARKRVDYDTFVTLKRYPYMDSF